MAGPKRSFAQLPYHERDGTNALWAATVGAHCLFNRLQVRLGSTLIEDIQEFGKLTEIMEKLSMSPQKRMDQEQLGFRTLAASANGSYFLADQQARCTNDCSKWQQESLHQIWFEWAILTESVDSIACSCRTGVADSVEFGTSSTGDDHQSQWHNLLPELHTY